MQLDLRASRQEHEPSEIMDARAIFPDAEIALVSVKTRFAQRSIELLETETREPGSANLEAYFQQVVSSYLHYFNAGMSIVMYGDQMVDFKVYLQRIFQFSVHALVAASMSKLEEAGIDIPGSVLDKFQLLEQVGTLTSDQAETMRTLQLLLYRLRYRTDVLNGAKLAQLTQLKPDSRAKIIAKLDTQMMTAQERTQLLKHLTKFNEIVTSFLNPGRL